VKHEKRRAEPNARANVGAAPRHGYQTIGMKDTSASVAIACLAGVSGSVACFMLHICMAGHMQHPPYAFWEYAMDVLWPAALIVGALRCGESKIRRKKVFIYLSIVLIPSRFLAGSLGGTALLWEVPIAVYLIVVSLRSAWLSVRKPPAQVVA
jgi:hypothetical protein